MVALGGVEGDTSDAADVADGLMFVVEVVLLLLGRAVAFSSLAGEELERPLERPVQLAVVRPWTSATFASFGGEEVAWLVPSLPSDVGILWEGADANATRDWPFAFSMGLDASPGEFSLAL